MSYPGLIPNGSYLLDGGHVHHTDAAVIAEQGHLANRRAVLAVGSNAAPARLVEKCGLDGTIPVISVSVRDHVAVYSAHISTYGSIAGTLFREDGVTTDLHVTFLDDAQLELVDATEGNYGRPKLRPGTVHGLPLDAPVSRYQSRWGPLLKDGSPIRLEAFTSTSRLPAMDQASVLDYAADLVGWPDGVSLSTAVRSGTADRIAVRERLSAP